MARRSKNKDINEERLFTRRAFILGGLQGGLVAVLGGRLAWLQLVEGRRYKTLSDKNRINVKMLMPSRGVIKDRRGELMAYNEQNFRALVIPEQTDDLHKSLIRLQGLIDLNEKEIDRILERSKKSASFVPLELKDNLNWEQVSRIEVNLTGLPGVFIDVGEVRSYPMREATAHIIGYVGAVSKSEIGDDPVLSLPNFKIGKTGIERAFDKQLRGTAGTSEIEVNVRGREVRELKRNAGRVGATIQLTIDHALQNYMQERLSDEKSASAVVMDVHSGAVYGLSSSPSFDPNLLTRGISAEKWEELLSDPGFPLNNKAVAGQYPPGSTFKMVTALAGLETGVITQNTSVHCPGHYDYGGSRFHCWKRGGHGRVDLIKALSESCDTYFYKMATEVGIDKIAEYANMLGIGHKLGIELSEERPGLMPNKAWKMGHHGEYWRAGETVIASIGQGDIQTTPLQLACMTARLVNGGFQVLPWLVARQDDVFTRDTVWPKIPVQKKHLDLIERGMRNVTTGRHGTARSSQISERRFYMGGKTGTAQVRRITMEDRLEGVQNKDLPWKYRHHALFVGYAPISKPRYACAVVVEHGGSGSATAAPIGRDLLHHVQKLDSASVQIAQDPDAAIVPVSKPKPVTPPAQTDTEEGAR